MGVRYFKRYRMELDLHGPALDVPCLPADFSWHAWHESLLADHARVKFESFRSEIDARIFLSFQSEAGCLQLMNAIRNKPNFIPEATWLIQGPQGFCGTVQGLKDRNGLGAIQNLGVVPDYRGYGLGRALMLRALRGFQLRGLPAAFLEVTAENPLAIRLYRELGFRSRKTVYKMVDSSTYSLIAESAPPR